MQPYYKFRNSFILYLGDVVKVLSELNKEFDMVFADPPYFLSNDGLTIQSGKIASVNKGEWDKLENTETIDTFNYKWIKAVRDKMKDNATIWISCTLHNLFSIGKVLEKLEFKILNIIVWQKTNPPPNFSCRYFTHSTEFVIWARKKEKVAHYFNYELMKSLNNGKQMKDVWLLPSVLRFEKKYGKHPTQKPLHLLARIILASTKENDLILDPFTGSSTTGIAANLLNRNFIGIDKNKGYLDLSIKRRLEIEDKSIFSKYKEKIIYRRD